MDELGTVGVLFSVVFTANPINLVICKTGCVCDGMSSRLSRGGSLLMNPTLPSIAHGGPAWTENQGQSPLAIPSLDTILTMFVDRHGRSSPVSLLSYSTVRASATFASFPALCTLISHCTSSSVVSVSSSLHCTVFTLILNLIRHRRVPATRYSNWQPRI